MELPHGLSVAGFLTADAPPRILDLRAKGLLRSARPAAACHLGRNQLAQPANVSVATLNSLEISAGEAPA